jgi:hypothetical protein
MRACCSGGGGSSNPGQACRKVKTGHGAPVVPAFVPIMLPAPETASAAKPCIVEIVIAGGRTVRVSTDIDTAALVRIVAALEGCR